MIYVVMQNKDVIEFENAETVRTSRDGHALHLIDEEKQIIGNIPLRAVRFYGVTLPPFYQKLLERQNEEGNATESDKA